jgi:anaerobic dimethyl sulfoxide reductase subunit A
VPKYLEDWESPAHPLARDYPLLLVTTHSRKRVHSTFDNVPWLRDLESHRVWLNSGDAAARGIRDGQRVRIYNQIGTVVLEATVTERIMPGVVALSQGAWHRPDARGRDWGGSVNVLCKDTAPPGEAPAMNAVLVEVARWEE